jgi:DNA-directed RNA polymerase specialized sigma24 family protein
MRSEVSMEKKMRIEVEVCSGAMDVLQRLGEESADLVYKDRDIKWLAGRAVEEFAMRVKPVLDAARAARGGKVASLLAADIGGRTRIDRARILELREAGMSQEDVAQALGCSVSSVARVMKEERGRETKTKGAAGR